MLNIPLHDCGYLNGHKFMRVERYHEVGAVDYKNCWIKGVDKNQRSR